MQLRSLVAPALALVVLGCGRRESAPASKDRVAVVHDAGALPTDAAPRPIDASPADGTLLLVGIDVLTRPADFQARAAGAGAKPMEPLVHAARDAVRALDAARPGALGDKVVVWLALRPGRKLRVWLATPDRTDTDAARAEVVAKVGATAAPEVTGPVAFTVTLDRSGRRGASHEVVLPPELQAVRPAGQESTPEALIERAWR